MSAPRPYLEPRAEAEPSTAAGAWWLDLGTLEMNFDAAALALLGTSADEEGGTSMPLQRFMTVYSGEGNNQSILQTVVRLARSQARFTESLRYRLKRKDGVEFEALLEFAAEVDAGGSVVGARGTLREIVAPAGLSIEQLVGLFPAAVIAVETERLSLLAANEQALAQLGFAEPWIEPPLLAELCDTAEDAARVNSFFARTESDAGARELRISVSVSGEDARPVLLRARLAAEHEPAVWMVSLEDLREQQAGSARVAEAVRSAESATQAATQVLEASGLAVAHIGPTGSVRLDERWASWMGSSEGDTFDSMQAWIQQCFAVDDAQALWQAVAQGERAAWPLALRWMPAGAMVRSLVVSPTWEPSADQTTRSLTGLLAQDQSDLVHLQTEAQLRSRNEEQVRAALARETATTALELCEQVQLALACSAVWLIAFAAEGASLESAWPMLASEAEATLAEGLNGALTGALAGLRTVAEPYAVTYAELDPLTQPMVAAFSGSAQIKSMLIVPIASEASSMRQALVAIQHDETRGWDAAASVVCQALAWRRQNRIFAEQVERSQHESKRLNEELTTRTEHLERLHAETKQLERAALIGNLLSTFSERLVNPLTAIQSSAAVARARAVEGLRASLNATPEEPLAAELDALLQSLEQPAEPAHPDQDRTYRDQVLRALYRLGETAPSRQTLELSEGLAEAQAADVSEELLAELNESTHRANWAAQLKVLNLLTLLREASNKLMHEVSNLQALAYLNHDEGPREVDLRGVVEQCLASVQQHPLADPAEWTWTLTQPVWAEPSTLEYVVLAMLTEAELGQSEQKPPQRSLQISGMEAGAKAHLEVSFAQEREGNLAGHIFARLATKFDTDSYGRHLDVLAQSMGGALSTSTRAGQQTIRLTWPLSQPSTAPLTLATPEHG